MPKTGRLTGPTKADGTQVQPKHQLGAGVDVELLGRNADLLVQGDLAVNGLFTVAGSPATGRDWTGGRSFSSAEFSPVDVAVSSSARASNVVTLTVPSGHGVIAGDLVSVRLATAGFDDTFNVSSVTATTILYSQTGSDLSGGAGQVARVLKRISTNGLSGVVLPAGRITSVLIGPCGYAPEWLNHGFTFGFDIANDHSASGNVVYRLIARKYNSFGNMASPTISVDATATIAGPGAGGMMTVTAPAWTDIAVPGDFFGSLFSFELQRVGNSGSDTLGGPIRLNEFATTVGSL